MRNIYFAAFLLLVNAVTCWGQDFEKVPPLLLDSTYKVTDANTSFLFNTIDFRKSAKNAQVQYVGTIQIVDADQPWPPRWYVPTIAPTNDSFTISKYLLVDARYQNGMVTFYHEKSREYKGHKEKDVAGYLVCNSKMEPIDTFTGTGRPINFHEFRINAKGEKLVMEHVDTVLDAREITGHAYDSAMKATIDLIEVFDSHDKLLFVWNPVKALGVNAFYKPYRFDKSYAAKPGYLDWSHGNAADWDFDGNIIYSLRHIGIGKISIADGHVMWQLQRNNMPYVFGKDTIEFYMQHGLEKVAEDANSNTYVLYSNGDNKHPGAYGLEFKVNKKDGAVTPLKTKWPPKQVLSISSGNYEWDAKGNYLLNYGVLVYKDPKDSVGDKLVLEYGNSEGKILAQYTLPMLVSAFKVHLLEGWRPPRPAISMDNHQLTAKGDMKEWNWYYLTDPAKKQVIKVGEGASWKPNKPGTYYVVGRYGMGYAVSLPFQVKE